MKTFVTISATVLLVITILLTVNYFVGFGYYLPHRDMVVYMQTGDIASTTKPQYIALTDVPSGFVSVDPEIKQYQYEIYTLEHIRDLYRETLIRNGIEIPEYIPGIPHIEVSREQSLIVTSKLGDARYNWQEVFDSPQEATRYLVLLDEKLSPYKAEMTKYPDTFIYGKESYPMLWNMNISIPADLGSADAQAIYDVLKSLGAWDDFRNTNETWRDNSK